MFPPEVASMMKQDLYVPLTQLMEKTDEKGYLLGLDFSKAYDVLDPQVARQIVLAYHWPENLVDFIIDTWVQQSRFASWKQHVHDRQLNSPAQPQGDPLGPLVRSLWVMSGFNWVRSRSTN